MNLIANFAVLASRRTIFDIPVCDLGWDEALTFTSELASLPVGQTIISFVNAHNLLLAVRDEEYRDVLSRTLVLPDGIGLDLASHVAHGSSFPANLNGTDFVPALLTFMESPRRIGLIGGRPEVLESAGQRLRAHTPWHEFIGISDGFFDKDDSSAVTDEVARQRLDILIVGMGTPLQEKWVYNNIRPEHARLVLTVGAFFDFASGAVPRAPKVVRTLRLEWSYRLLQEPRRLWRRYLLGIPRFLYQVARHRFARRSRVPQPPRPAPVAPPRRIERDRAAG
ncbi:WecB/TagA/CpsF family glycosyltransferase [Rhizobium sp. BK251]|uniref:WecB/TagA/CpsF family glycosyltransferase n=1 Tax=Rhizobium sp. BK251 TaxID=2512125 RepID=UPI00104E910C|nr:WecB/TagA/CpsF family glycosyltransferase [Rhizobium sp. BK251]TCL75653.1 exopolysaccharide biosynthesis WecB/TagA/CpsF family protein [Rhizobium sp. BK251]